jgi:NADPH:quinone reductase-like Zn-dependent oxidoreductase
MSIMKAIRFHTYGSPDVLVYEDAPRPTAGDGEVLIRVHTTSVNPFDCAVRAGYMAGYFNHTLPLIPGSDVAGTVEAVGAGVTSFKSGDSVYARAGVYRDGSNAEYVVAASTDVAAKPRSIDLLHSAALPHVTLTAWQALIETAQIAAGQTVLIHGAAGGVGHIAVQLAHWRGAKVIGTASTHIDVLRELKVDEIINYATTPFESVVHDVDVVIDTVGGDTQARSWAVLKRGGILVSTIQAPVEETAVSHGVRQGMVYASPPIGPTLTQVATLVDEGIIKPIVSVVLPLSETRQAHVQIEGKHVAGKLVLQVA